VDINRLNVIAEKTYKGSTCTHRQHREEGRELNPGECTNWKDALYLWG